MSIEKNLSEIRDRIEHAAMLSGRRGKDIKLVAVTKTVGVERIREAVALGVTAIGENRVQEMVEKYEQLKDLPVEWHFIGHLQTNKVKYIIDKVDLIHSLDRLSLAREINKRAAKINRKIDVLVQVNVSGEETKFGLFPDQVKEFIKGIMDMEHIRIKGLMTIAPYTEQPEEVRPIFRRLKQLSEEIRGMGLGGVYMEYLSMGMTGDYTVAIEEGANIVRIGTGIFGEREY